MNIKNQVTSLETSKKLKELGVEQESIFFWIQTYDSTLAPILNHSIARAPSVRGDLYLVDRSPNGRNYAAFTASELAEMLPSCIYKGENRYFKLNIVKYDDVWAVCYHWHDHDLYLPNGNKLLVEALADCLVYLKENKLI